MKPIEEVKTINITLKDGKFFIKSNAENVSELNDIIRAVAFELEAINNDRQSEILDQLCVGFEIDDEFLRNSIFGESIVDQEIRGHAKKLLSTIEINTIYELVKIKPNDFKKYRGFGSATEVHISNFLKSKGLHFEMTDEDIRMYYYEMVKNQKDAGKFWQFKDGMKVGD